MILVTGGAGFIGSNLVNALSGKQEIALCDFWGSTDKWKNVIHASISHFIFPEQLSQWLTLNGKRLTAIVHLGAISATTERDVDLIVRSNLQLSKSLWDIAAELGIAFIYASSAATYGNGAEGFEDRSDWAYQNALRPLNAYGWSKLAFDRQVLAEVKAGNPTPPKWAGLKFFNVYGPREGHKGSMQSVPHRNFEKLMAGEPLRLFRSEHSEYLDGGQKRDFVFVGDCVDTIIWMLDNSFPSDIYNVGSGRAETWLQVGEAMFAALGREPNIEFVDLPEALKGRYQYFTEADMSKSMRVGCPLPKTCLLDGVAHTYDFLNLEAKLR